MECDVIQTISKVQIKDLKRNLYFLKQIFAATKVKHLLRIIVAIVPQTEFEDVSLNLCNKIGTKE